jgi:hypothetical protein
MLEKVSSSTAFQAGQVAYLRVRVLGFDRLDGREAAILRAVDKAGEFIDGEIWYYCEPRLLVPGATVVEEINRAATNVPDLSVVHAAFRVSHSSV